MKICQQLTKLPYAMQCFTFWTTLYIIDTWCIPYMTLCDCVTSTFDLSASKFHRYNLQVSWNSSNKFELSVTVPVYSYGLTRERRTKGRKQRLMLSASPSILWSYETSLSAVFLNLSTTHRIQYRESVAQMLRTAAVLRTVFCSDKIRSTRG